jgi:multicomponent Na+:H+ antiporter subunit E
MVRHPPKRKIVKMLGFLVTVIAVFLGYMLLISGGWSSSETVVGLLVALLSVSIAYPFYRRDPGIKFNPLRWVGVVVYVAVPFFIEVVKANLDVALRVITGRIRPGIIVYDPQTKTDFGTMMVANSITLTPGTLSVDVDPETNRLYVHVIHVDEEGQKRGVWKGKDIFTFFDLSAWVRRIAE